MQVDLLQDRVKSCQQQLGAAKSHLRAVEKGSAGGQPSQESPVAQDEPATQESRSRWEKAQQRLERARVRLAAGQARLVEMRHWKKATS